MSLKTLFEDCDDGCEDIDICHELSLIKKRLCQKWVKVSAFNNISITAGTAGNLQIAGINTDINGNNPENTIAFGGPVTNRLNGWQFSQPSGQNRFIAEEDGLYEFTYSATFQNYDNTFENLFRGWLPGQRFLYLKRNESELLFPNSFLGNTIFVPGKPECSQATESTNAYRLFCLVTVAATIPLKRGDSVTPYLYADYCVIPPSEGVVINPYIGVFTEIEVVFKGKCNFDFIPETM